MLAGLAGRWVACLACRGSPKRAWERPKLPCYTTAVACKRLNYDVLLRWTNGFSGLLSQLHCTTGQINIQAINAIGLAFLSLFSGPSAVGVSSDWRRVTAHYASMARLGPLTSQALVSLFHPSTLDLESLLSISNSELGLGSSMPGCSLDLTAYPGPFPLR